MNFPESLPRAAPPPAPFVIAAAGLDHPHLFDQCRSLVAAGAHLKWIHDADPVRSARLQSEFPAARVARSLEEILDDPQVHLVTSAAIPCDRGPLGCRVMRAGKDFFVDKAPFTTLDQLAEARRVVAETGRKYLVYFSERLHHGAVRRATELIREGAIGRVLHVSAFGPHRLGNSPRPAWFFERAKYGGILCDLSCHAIEQFLTWVDSADVAVTHALTANHAHPHHPELEDYGEVALRADSGATAFVRVDWLTPAGLSTWGDGRTFIVGTRGTLELRKYVDVAREQTGNHLYLVDDSGEHHVQLENTDPTTAFAPLIADCLDRTETGMAQEHLFKVAELSLHAQALAARAPHR